MTANLNFVPKFGLAPMEGITDFPARVWFFLMSAPDFLSTPFLRLGENFPKYEIPSEWCPEILVPELAEIIPYACIPQFMSPEPGYFISSAKKLLDRTAFVDLNCGCPAPKAVGKGAGSSLLLDIGRFRAFIAEIVGEIGSEQLSVKMRVGFHNADNFSALIDTLADVKVRRLSVHGRTRDQAYLGLADWNLIAAAAQTLPFPILGSGDVQDGATLAKKLAVATKVAGVLVGRGALRNPWLFDELRSNQAIIIDLRSLPFILATFAILNQQFLSNFPLLCQVVRELFAANHPQDMLARWQSIFSLLVRVLYDRNLSPVEIDIERRSLGRLKLLWGYIRTSLPTEFFHPPLMRSNSLREFIEGLNNLGIAYYERSGLNWVRPQVDSTHDWMFSGERRR